MLLEEDAASGISVAEQQELFKDVTEEAKKATKEANKTTKKALALANGENCDMLNSVGLRWKCRAKKAAEKGIKADEKKKKAKAKATRRRRLMLHENPPCEDTANFCDRKPEEWQHPAKHYCNATNSKDNSKIPYLARIMSNRGKYVRMYCPKTCGFCDGKKPPCEDTAEIISSRNLGIVSRRRERTELGFDCNPVVWNRKVSRRLRRKYNPEDPRSWTNQAKDYCKWAASSRRRTNALYMKKYCPVLCDLPEEEEGCCEMYQVAADW